MLAANRLRRSRTTASQERRKGHKGRRSAAGIRRRLALFWLSTAEPAAATSPVPAVCESGRRGSDVDERCGVRSGPEECGRDKAGCETARWNRARGGAALGVSPFRVLQALFARGRPAVAKPARPALLRGRWRKGRVVRANVRRAHHGGLAPCDEGAGAGLTHATGPRGPRRNGGCAASWRPATLLGGGARCGMGRGSPCWTTTAPSSPPCSFPLRFPPPAGFHADGGSRKGGVQGAGN